MNAIARYFHRRIPIVVWMAVLSTGLGLMGSFWWFLDLFSHFRLQYLALCVLGVVWFWWQRDRVGVIASCAGCSINLVVVFGLSAGSAPIMVTKDFHLRVASINVHTTNHRADKVIEFARHSGADIVFLMEIDGWWAKALAPLKQHYPHSLIESREDNFGVAFFSKDKPARLIVRSIGDADVPTVLADMTVAGREFQFIATHPLPPSGRRNSLWRDDQLLELRGYVNKTAVPVLLVGDLNATPWSEGMRILTVDGRLRLPSTQFTWVPSWMVPYPLAIPIDHALASAPLVVLRREIGPDVGSDHRPILVDVGWSQ